MKTRKGGSILALWPHRLARSRTPDFHSDNRGSNPLGVNPETLAQSVEHLTFNERVDGSSPSSLNHSKASKPIIWLAGAGLEVSGVHPS